MANMTMGSNKVFIDTNVLIYLNNKDNPFHDDVLNTIQSLQRESAELIVSDHVVKEFLVVKSNLLQIQKRYDSVVLLNDYNFFLKAFNIYPPPETILQKLVELITSHNLKGHIIHDAFIAAFCLESGIKTIFTVNKKDFSLFEKEGLHILEIRKKKDE